MTHVDLLLVAPATQRNLVNFCRGFIWEPVGRAVPILLGIFHEPESVWEALGLHSRAHMFGHLTKPTGIFLFFPRQ